MSRTAVLATCPLSDCTLAVDNAENIRNSNDKALLGLKVASVRPAKNEKAPTMRRERVTSAARTTATTAATTPSTPAPALEAHRPSSLDLHIHAKPFTPVSTPRRNDPYAACLLNSPCTPEDSFYACYCEVALAESEAPTSALNTPVRPRVSAPKTSIGETTRNLLEMLSLISTPNRSPINHANVTAPAQPAPELLSTASSPERATTPPQPSTSTRVVRKVVSCNVDRTSGRPVPKPRAA